MKNARKALRNAYKTEQNTYEPICDTLKKARALAGISRERLAARMGLSDAVWTKYENGAIRIPNTLMIKLLMFGIDFWSEQHL